MNHRFARRSKGYFFLSEVMELCRIRSVGSMSESQRLDFWRIGSHDLVRIVPFE